MAKPAHVKPKRRSPPRALIRVAKVTPRNRETIRVLKEWMNSPPIYDKAFWEDFERELRENRFNLRQHP